MITSLSFANPRPVYPQKIPAPDADNDNQQWEALNTTRMRCVFCTRTHCSCSGEGPLGAA